MNEQLPIRPITDAESAFAFVLGILFNQQMDADRAWTAPWVLAERLGGSLTPEAILSHSPEEFDALFARSPAVHVFVKRMAANVREVAELIEARYKGDVRGIWTPTVPANDIIRNFILFPGIGEHKARVALFVLTRYLGVPVYVSTLSDYSIAGCGKLAARFYPDTQPLLIPFSGKP